MSSVNCKYERLNRYHRRGIGEETMAAECGGLEDHMCWMKRMESDYEESHGTFSIAVMVVLEQQK